MNPGDAVLVRGTYDGRVTSCHPCRYVGDWAGRHGLYCQPGSRVRRIRVAGESYLEGLAAGAEPLDHIWNTHHVLWFVRLGESHALGLFWGEEWEFRGWYVNLQSPTRLHGICFDTNDLALDVWVEPDGSWEWKDEDDFAEAQELGIIDAAAAAEVRAEGERVIAERPWPTGWEDWRPPAEWDPLPLPEDWHVL